MFKFNIPLTIILSTGSLTLLAIGSLLLISSTAYTSDIQVAAEARNFDEYPDENSISSTLLPPLTIVSSASSIKSINAKDINGTQPPLAIDSRRRSGRAYHSQQSMGYDSNQQSSLDSYAAALAAANAPNSQDQSSGLAQTSMQANDVNSFASFGEQTNSGASSTSSAGRQLSMTGGDYGGPYSSSAYYGGYMSPSSNAASYNTGYSGNSPSSGASYHSSPVHHYSQHHKTPVLPLGYPTNSYDRQASGLNYYDRSYMNAASTPMWASGLPTGSSGLMSSASSALSHWTGGFGIAEIICGLVAIAIGAIILGAPFFLIYLALMGNFSGSGTLNLTNPTQGTTPATTPTNGRRKRLAIFEQLSSLGERHHISGSLSEIIMSQLSPFIDLQQVNSSFKRLVESIEKYSNLKPETSQKSI